MEILLIPDNADKESVIWVLIPYDTLYIPTCSLTQSKHNNLPIFGHSSTTWEYVI